MSGAWIKVRHDLLDAPEVRRLARLGRVAETGTTRSTASGRMATVWRKA